MRRGARKMGVRVFLTGILFLGLFLMTPCLSSEEIYRWTDEKGTTHFTDDASTIPEKYRREAEEKKVIGEATKEEAAREDKIIKESGQSGKGADRVRKYLEKTDQKIE